MFAYILVLAQAGILCWLNEFLHDERLAVLPHIYYAYSCSTYRCTKKNPAPRKSRLFHLQRTTCCSHRRTGSVDLRRGPRTQGATQRRITREKDMLKSLQETATRRVSDAPRRVSPRNHEVVQPQRQKHRVPGRNTLVCIFTKGSLVRTTLSLLCEAKGLA